MEILHHRDLQKKDHKELLGYLPYVKLSLKEWMFVDIRLSEMPEDSFAIERAAEEVHALYKNREGKLYICNDREILMLVRWGKDNPAEAIATDIGTVLPKEECQVYVHEPTMGGIAKLEILITYRRASTTPTYADTRATRRENIVIVADDDMYMRMLVKKGLGPDATVIEVADGGDVIETYKKNVPDIIFLDIHMPKIEGNALLEQILKTDPRAYIIMLSADSSRENVKIAVQKGAKGFLTKPFTKERLHEYLAKCPTIS